MTKLPLISGKNLLRLLIKAGFYISHIEGSHHYLRHTDGRKTCVPVHRNEDIQRPLLKLILKQAGLKEEDYMRLR